ncbi:MAG: SnoaL-like domain-containing protein [Pseudomonadota bacterium]
MFNQQLMDVANKLVEGCKANNEREGLDTLYHPEAESHEAMAMEGSGSRMVKGIDGIKAKHDWWENAHEMHDGSVEGPFFHGADKFSVIFGLDVTNRETKERMQMKEVALYTVDQGKIVKEEFFYGAG